MLESKVSATTVQPYLGATPGEQARLLRKSEFLPEPHLILNCGSPPDAGWRGDRGGGKGGNGGKGGGPHLGGGFGCSARAAALIVVCALAGAGAAGARLWLELGALREAVDVLARAESADRAALGVLTGGLVDEVHSQYDALGALAAQLAFVNSTLNSMQREVTNAQLKDEVDVLRHDVAAMGARVDAGLADESAQLRAEMADEEATIQLELKVRSGMK